MDDSFEILEKISIIAREGGIKNGPPFLNLC
jgi:hypothetical protein